MGDPYNNNPFATRKRREPRNESEAHEALRRTMIELDALNRFATDLLKASSRPVLRLVK